MARPTPPQEYPRISNGSKLDGYLNEARLTPHKRRIPAAELRKIIVKAVRDANRKSSRAILDIAGGTSEQEMRDVYLREGRKLFDYFRKYCGDPASTAFECLGRHYREIAREQFRNRTLQKERMNSGWRYQFMARDCAMASRRFQSVSDIGASEADFNLTIETRKFEHPHINIYVSVKNRTNTMGGQDWPKAIVALEAMARDDKNRTGPYLCVFGIAMERGERLVKAKKGGTSYSVNTEIWLSDFFWPFLSNHSYEEIMTAVLDALIDQGRIIESTTIGIEVPEELLDSFGKCCAAEKLLDQAEKFHDPHSLVSFFCKRPGSSK